MNGFDRTALNGLTSFASDYSAWTGRKGVTDRIVFEVLIEIAKRDSDKEGNFSASYRQVTNLTNITHKTIMRSFRRLIQDGLILRKNAGLSGITSIWSFTPQLLDRVAKYTTSMPNLSGLIKTLQDEMGLRKSSARVYQYLLDNGASRVVKIAADLHLSPHQVYRALSDSALRGRGLVQNLKRGVWQANELNKFP